MNFNECVRRFCTEKLARIFYDCLVCSASNRALFDWLAAERFVLASGPALTVMVELFRTGLQVTKLQENFASFDQLCGRAVWELFYQPFRRELRLGHEGVTRYTAIRFG